MRIDFYKKLKETDYNLYTNVIKRASILSINNNLDLRLGSDIELELVKTALEGINNGNSLSPTF